MTTNWKRIATDLLMIAFLVVFPHMGLLPMFAFSILLLLLIGLYLKFFKEGFGDIGFKFSAINLKSVWLGGVIGVGYAMLAYWGIGPFFDRLGFTPANLSDFKYIRHNTINYLYLLSIAGFLVIPFEEIVFRGFIFTRIKALFGYGKWAFTLSGLITSILFALYHYQEGTGAMLSIFLFALFITWLYKVFDGNLWYLIFFHIFYDVFMLSAIYLGYM